jgi:hypothetical protein
MASCCSSSVDCRGVVYNINLNSFKNIFNLNNNRNDLLSAFRPRGVPGPTSKLSLRVPAQMSRRETEHKGETIRGIATSCCPAPRADALAVGGYKRSRGR